MIPSLPRQRAFTLLELLIAIAVIGIVFAIALPTWRYYVNTANMSKVNAAYDTAIHIAQQEFLKDQTRIALGLPSTLPTSTDAWGKVFDPLGHGKAPGGGPIYDTQTRHRSRSRTTDNQTGAIQVYYNPRRGWLDIYRPAYLQLTPLRARVTSDGVTVTKL